MSKIEVFVPSRAALLKTADLPVRLGASVLVIRFEGEIDRAFANEQLMKHLGAFTTTPVLRKTENGKPFVDGGDVHFNVSHSDNLWALAIHRTRDVGIDIEAWRERSRLQKIAGRFFTPAEQEKLAKIGDDAKFVEAALTFWTRKEAFAKMTGSTILRELFESQDIETRSGATFLTVSESSDFVLSLAVANS